MIETKVLEKENIFSIKKSKQISFDILTLKFSVSSMSTITISYNLFDAIFILNSARIRTKFIKNFFFQHVVPYMMKPQTFDEKKNTKNNLFNQNYDTKMWQKLIRNISLLASQLSETLHRCNKIFFIWTIWNFKHLQHFFPMIFNNFLKLRILWIRLKFIRLH